MEKENGLRELLALLEKVSAVCSGFDEHGKAIWFDAILEKYRVLVEHNKSTK
jgi:hypothetical protein